MRISQTNTYTPNFNGFVRISNVNRHVGTKVSKLTDFVLNTEKINNIRPLERGKKSLGAVIEMENEDVIKIQGISAKGSENAFDTIVSSIIKAHKEGYNYLKVLV